ncbi:hypothetical protein ACFYT3_04260 [Nocardia amikacinitolerans]|uniref:hypothetical protein n=1 Tax=Nocardia amikacinitolerans TaxID=756689 RepID=UPI0036929D2C
MGAGEGGVHQGADVRVPFVDGHAGAVLDRAGDLVHVGEVDHRIDALGMVATGSARETLTTDTVSAAFDHPVEVTYDRGRWTARAKVDALRTFTP